MSTFLKQSYAAQLADRLREQIRSGAWPAGMRLPTIRQLAADYRVSTNTIQLALRTLERESLIRRRPAGGAYVQPSAQTNAPAPTPAPRPRAASRTLSHIALIGAAGHNAVVNHDRWGTRISMAAEATLLEEASQHYLTRVSSVRPTWEECVNDQIAQLQPLAPHLSGAIIFCANHTTYTQMQEELDRLALPWVSINRPNDRLMHNFVSADNLAAGKTAGRCFTLLGFRKVLVLSTDLKHSASETRKVHGLIEAYLHHELPIDGIRYLRSPSYEEAHGYETMRTDLKQHGPPEAIFSTGDLLALGAIRACREAGLDVPGQVSVVGSTGLDVAQYASPSLTVVTQPMEAMGQTAARLLIQMIHDGTRRTPGRQLPGQLILRDSLAPLSVEARQTLTAENLLPLESEQNGESDGPHELIETVGVWPRP